jgi:hypothetical protein
MIRRAIHFLGSLIALVIAGCLALRIAASPDAFSYLLLAGAVSGFLMLYFLPTIVARKRGIAVGTEMIFWVNLLIGWTVIGWVVCLLWAALGESRQRVASYAR